MLKFLLDEAQKSVDNAIDVAVGVIDWEQPPTKQQVSKLIADGLTALVLFLKR